MGTHSGRSFYAGESTTQTLSITRPFFTVNRTATAFGRLLLMIREVRNPHFNPLMTRQFRWPNSCLGTHSIPWCQTLPKKVVHSIP